MALRDLDVKIKNQIYIELTKGHVAKSAYYYDSSAYGYLRRRKNVGALGVTTNDHYLNDGVFP